MIKYKINNEKELKFICNHYNFIIRKDIMEDVDSKLFIFIKDNKYESYCVGDCKECGKLDCWIRVHDFIEVQDLMKVIRTTKLERICNVSKD